MDWLKLSSGPGGNPWKSSPFALLLLTCAEMEEISTAIAWALAQSLVLGGG